VAAFVAFGLATAVALAFVELGAAVVVAAVVVSVFVLTTPSVSSTPLSISSCVSSASTSTGNSAASTVAFGRTNAIFFCTFGLLRCAALRVFDFFGILDYSLPGSLEQRERPGLSDTIHNEKFQSQSTIKCKRPQEMIVHISHISGTSLNI
jgi:hypothetical protein